MTWYQVGIVSKELPEIGWRTNVLTKVIAELDGQVAFLANTLKSQKVWSLVEFDFPRYTPAVVGIKISE